MRRKTSFLLPFLVFAVATGPAYSVENYASEDYVDEQFADVVGYVDSKTRTIKNTMNANDNQLFENQVVLRDMLNGRDADGNWITLDTEAQLAIPAINELHAELADVQAATESAVTDEDVAGAITDALADYTNTTDMNAALDAVQTALETAIAGKQDAGDYAAASDLEDLKTAVEKLQSDSTSADDLQALQDKITAIESDYATATDVSAADAALQAAINNLSAQIDAIDLSVFAKTADLAAVATSGSYTDLINIPTDLVNESGLNAAVAGLTELINEKQAAGDYLVAADLAELEAAVATLESGKATVADLQALQTTVSNLGDTYATDADVANVAANVASNLEYITANAQAIQEINTELDGLATVAKTGSYNDLADKPTLITQDDLNTLRTALESEIAKKQDAGEFATAASLKLVSDSLATLKADSYTKAEIDQMIADAVSGGQIDLSGYLTVAVFNDALAGLQVKDTELSDGLVALTESLGGYVKKTDLAAVATSGSYKDLTDTPDLSQYVTNETIQNNYVTNTALEQKNYVTESTLEQKNYLTQEQAADTYLTTDVAASTYVTEQQVNNALNAYEIPDGSITAVKLADGAVSAEKINTGTGNAGEMMMLVSNGDGTSSWVSIEIE